MNIKEKLKIISMLCVYQEPVVIKKFLPTKHCDHIIKESTKKLETSRINLDVIDETIRKSQSTQFFDNSIGILINKKCSDILQKPEFKHEALHIVHYIKGGFYKPHFDSGGSHIHGIPRRSYTFIIALNDDYEGGETYFPYLNRSFKLKKGDALLFHNYNTDGSETKLSMHGGKELLNGEKWIANLWIS